MSSGCLLCTGCSGRNSDEAYTRLELKAGVAGDNVAVPNDRGRGDPRIILPISAWTNMFPAYVQHVSSGCANFDEFDDNWTMSP